MKAAPLGPDAAASATPAAPHRLASQARQRGLGRFEHWRLIAALTLGVALVDATTAFDVRWPSWIPGAAGCAALLALSAFYARYRETADRRIAETLHEAAILLAYGLPAASISYVVLGAGAPPWDAQLARADLALGFDWPAWYGVVDGTPALQRTLDALYRSSLAQIAIVLVATGLAGRVDRTRELNALLVATSLPIVLLSGIVPAESAWVHHGLGLEKAYHLEVVTALRDGSLRTLDAGEMLGIVTFPSFHTAIALVLVWVSRGIGWLFWPMLLANAGVLLSIPSEGGHYLVDMIAGALVTFAAIAIAARRSRARLRLRHRLVGGDDLREGTV